MIGWIKKHWLTVGLIIVIVLLLGKNFSTGNLNRSGISVSPLPYTEGASADSFSALKSSPASLSLQREVAPTDNPDRLVIQNTSLSLQVKEVAPVLSQIEVLAKGYGGYMVSSDLAKPEFSASGNITIRVPEDKRAEALDSFKKLAVKTVSEHVSGFDVTDQYTDIEARLAVLNQTKNKFEEIMAKAVTVADLLNVQRELINLQSQIDSLKGQQEYYKQSAKLTKISIYLSTDELSLPYAPDKSWRPTVIFKQAVRSLVSTLRGFGTLIIWLVVYIPVIFPIVGIIWWIKFRRRSRL
jgi:hypothetical protein